MKNSRALQVVLALAAALAVTVLIWLARRPASEPKEEAGAGPVASVKVAELRRGRIEGTLMAYGAAVPAADKLAVVSAPFECRVARLLVAGGQPVAADAPLLTIEPSPEARLEFRQAEEERKAAAEAEKLMEQRMDMKLATLMELNDARQRLAAAQVHLQSLQKRGMGGSSTLKAEKAGVVSRIAVQKGQIVPAGDPLLELIGADQIEARLGVEVEDRGYLHLDQEVKLLPVNALEDQAIAGRVRLITEQVNPETRLVDVFVAPAAGSHLLLNEYLRGKIVIESSESLLAPREAVLPQGGNYVLFTVAGGLAHEQTVTVGLENAKEIEVSGEELSAGQQVVVQGQSELEDGMAVQVEPAK
jgi:RND family efflux transporter MFP subunit